MILRICFILCLLVRSVYADDEFIENLNNTYLVSPKSNSGITKIILDTEHKKIKVWESCVPKDCDWGIVKYSYKDDKITAFYLMGDIKKLITIELKGETMLAEIRYLIDNKITKTVNYELKSQKNRIK